jgi:hypothetical protein
MRIPIMGPDTSLGIGIDTKVRLERRPMVVAGEKGSNRGAMRKHAEYRIP